MAAHVEVRLTPTQASVQCDTITRVRWCGVTAHLHPSNQCLAVLHWAEQKHLHFLCRLICPATSANAAVINPVFVIPPDLQPAVVGFGRRLVAPPRWHTNVSDEAVQLTFSLKSNSRVMHMGQFEGRR
jgi:hypothetical protein